MAEAGSAATPPARAAVEDLVALAGLELDAARAQALLTEELERCR